MEFARIRRIRLKSNIGVVMILLFVSLTINEMKD